MPALFLLRSASGLDFGVELLSPWAVSYGSRPDRPHPFSPARFLMSPSQAEALRPAVRRKIMLRLLPLLMLCYFVAYLDRINISIAGPNGMNQTLGLTATTFGLASGIFFVGYVLLEVPSNLALHKFGAKIWISRILVTWGVVASATAFVQNADALYVLRFLLGIAEAGFAPGILLYLTYWFAQRDRGQAFAIFLIGLPLSSTVGAPLTSWLVERGHNWVFGLDGWRFMILVTGLPAAILGVACYFLLPNGPAHARWLREDERELVLSDVADQATGESHDIRTVLTSPRVWLLGLGFFGLVYGLYAVSFFLPTIIQDFQARFDVKYSIFQVGLLTGIPFGAATVFTLLWARHSRKTNEVPLHVAGCAVLGTAGILFAIWASSPYLILLGITIATMGLVAGLPLFFGMPTKFLTGGAAAAGLALINTIGNLGGFAGPYIYGWMKNLTGSGDVGLYLIAGLCGLSALIAIGVSRWRSIETGDRERVRDSRAA